MKLWYFCARWLAELLVVNRADGLVRAGGLSNSDNSDAEGGDHSRRRRSTPVGPVETEAARSRSGSIVHLGYRRQHRCRRELDIGHRSHIPLYIATASQPVPEAEGIRSDSTSRLAH